MTTTTLDPTTEVSAADRRAARAARTAQEAREVYDRTDDERKRENARCAALVASQAQACAGDAREYIGLMKDARWMLRYAIVGERAYELAW